MRENETNFEQEYVDGTKLEKIFVKFCSEGQDKWGG